MVKETHYNNTGTTIVTTDYYVRDVSGNVISIYNKSVFTSGAIIQKELPIYGGSRLGVYNKQGTTQYQITDHLGNVRAVIEKINGRMEIADYADYYPFGEKLPLRNTFSEYRYAFQGQELDKETGMEAFQLRLWDGRIGRWLTTDPYGQYHSPYLGMGNNPISGIDPDGGYKTWFGAAFAWVGGGFKGSIDHDSGGYYIESFFDVEGGDGGGAGIFHDYGGITQYNGPTFSQKLRRFDNWLEGQPKSSQIIGGGSNAGWMSVWGEHKDGYSTGFRGIVRHSVENTDFASLGVNATNYTNGLNAALIITGRTSSSFGIGDQIGGELIKIKSTFTRTEYTFHCNTKTIEAKTTEIHVKHSNLSGKIDSLKAAQSNSDNLSKAYQNDYGYKYE